MRKTTVFILLMTLSALLLISCSSRNYDMASREAAANSQGDTQYQSHPTNEQPPSMQLSSGATTTNDIRDIKIPAELVGSPDRIYIVKGKQEKIFEAGTDDYNKIIGLVCDRFPETLKEAALAIEWADNGEFNWGMMAGEIDFLRLTYDTAQTVKMNCMNENYKDLPEKEINFNDLVFPLTDDYNKVCMIGTSNTYGVLDNSSEILAELLRYVD